MLLLNKNRAVARKPRDAAVNFDRYGVCRQLLSFVTRGKLIENGAKVIKSFNNCTLLTLHFRTDFTDLSLYCIKGVMALVVLVSFSGYVC